MAIKSFAEPHVFKRGDLNRIKPYDNKYKIRIMGVEPKISVQKSRFPPALASTSSVQPTFCV